MDAIGTDAQPRIGVRDRPPDALRKEFAMPEETANKVDTLKRWLLEARSAVAFTGAGISTESGIPDFRSKDGFWTKHQPIMFDEFVRSLDARRESWRRKFSMDNVFKAARPNVGHMTLARLHSDGHLACVITQNVDNLHHESGIPAEHIIELHGNGSYATCLDCGERHELDWIRMRLEDDYTPPECNSCGGILKTATISFGQAMPADQMIRADAATRAADLFLVAGSSLVVYPAAGFPALAKRCGARLVILNRDPTELDDLADLVVNDEIGPVLGQVYADKLQ
jgi:NAD-dependent deacetylase